MVVDLETTLAILELTSLNDVDRFEKEVEAEHHPLGPNFVLYYAIDVNADDDDDDDEIDDGVKHCSMSTFSDCREVDTFLY